ncbi:MAG: hypothetical protein ACJ790_17810, partial [Myxococcaceae bacterium]
MSARSAVTLGAALLALVLSGCSSSGGSSCGPGTCTGCCSASGLCDLGSTTAACGASGNACVSCSAGFDCVLGSCAPKVSNPDSGFTGSGTCVTTGCPSGQQCNQASGICEAHCPSGSNSECPQPGFCDQSTKLCRCSPGSHLCGSTCSSNNSISTCGDRCSPCEANGGTATCDGTICGITCSSDLKACGSTCATCPAQATSTSCDGESCVAQSCANGYLACQGTCSQCPTNAASTGCVGSQCSALGCFSGDHLCSGQCVYSGDPDTCGARCSPCPAPTAHGFPTCTTGQCGVTCNSGYTACGTECTTCPTGAGVATTTCSGNQCVAATCNAGYKVCAGNCAACPEGATATACSGATCTATACGAGFTVSSGNCIGLRTLPEDGLGSAAPVGVAHVDGGVPASAWDTSSSVKVAVLNPDGGLGAPSVRGNSNSGAVSFGADATSTQHLLYVDSPFNGTNTLHHSSRPSGGAWTDEIAYTASGFTILLDSSIAVM